MSIFRHFRFGPLDRQLDTKGRISLPVDWRPPADESFYLVKVKVFGVPGAASPDSGSLREKARGYRGIAWFDTSLEGSGEKHAFWSHG